MDNNPALRPLALATVVLDLVVIGFGISLVLSDLRNPDAMFFGLGAAIGAAIIVVGSVGGGLVAPLAVSRTPSTVARWLAVGGATWTAGAMTLAGLTFPLTFLAAAPAATLLVVALLGGRADVIGHRVSEPRP